MTSDSGAHILVYPYPASGHIIPFLDLTQRLLTRGLTVTVSITPNNVSLLQPLLSSHTSSIQPLILSQIHTNGLGASIKSMRELHYPEIIQWFKSHSHPSPPVAIISDFFLGWTHQLGRDLGVPRLVFSPSGMFGLSLSLSLWRDTPRVDDPEDLNSVVSFPNIPNSPTYPWWQVPRHYRHGKEGDPDWELFRENSLANSASWGAVFNSFAELEGVYFDHLKKELGHDRVWAVGPLLPEDDDEAKPSNRGGSSSVPLDDFFNWLDDQPDSSVVYIGFGSRTVLTREQMDVLTTALKQSHVRFVLCIVVKESDGRLVEDDSGVVPDGFEDQLGSRGFVIKGWAPQVAILRHRAVGAFLTHCGWNSVLEGLSAGVVMLTWPMGADQYGNATLLVDQLGAAIRAGEGTENIPEATTLAQQLDHSLDRTRPEWTRTKELSVAARVATKEGNSEKDMDELVKNLNEIKRVRERRASME